MAVNIGMNVKITIRKGGERDYLSACLMILSCYISVKPVKWFSEPATLLIL